MNWVKLPFINKVAHFIYQLMIKNSFISKCQSVLTVPELMTIYLFGQLNRHFKKRAIYNFINHYWQAGFAHLPSYQAFVRRLNLLGNNFQSYFAYLLKKLKENQSSNFPPDYLIQCCNVSFWQQVKTRISSS
jgi:hypothetical protein